MQEQELVHPERSSPSSIWRAAALGFGGWLALFVTDALVPLELGESRALSWLRLATDHAARTSCALALLAWSLMRGTIGPRDVAPSRPP